MKSLWILRSLSPATVAVCLMWSFAMAPSQVVGQVDAPVAPKGLAEKEPGPSQPAAGEKPPSTLVVIPDEPKTVDPATLIPPALAIQVTVRFNEQPLRDIVKWLQQDRSFNVLVDYHALANEGILVGEPITDHSDGAPIYLLLNRLQSMQLGWYFEDDTLFVTSVAQSEQHTTTIPYNLGDLFDAGYKPQSVRNTVLQTTGGKWQNLDGEGGASVLLGDVLFVRQTFQQHQEVAGLFAALGKHGKRTLILDPAQHEILRQKLHDKVTVEFVETPLNAAIQEISRKVGADIRLDHKPMDDEGISERAPVSLKMTGRPLNAVLRALLLKLGLTWRLDNGVLWVTTLATADTEKKTAVFDVRDLCRDQKESSGLMAAIQTQTGGKWQNLDGEGGMMICPKPGVLVTRQTEQCLDDISKLLDAYRTALRASNPREVSEGNPDELITSYYRLQKDIALDLEKLLPELIQPPSWKSPAQPEAKGTIRLVASKSGLLNTVGVEVGSGQDHRVAAIVPNSVLIIQQSRKIHNEINNVIYKIQNGDSGGTTGGMMGGGMGGGMGGSFRLFV